MEEVIEKKHMKYYVNKILIIVQQIKHFYRPIHMFCYYAPHIAS